jgi:hypothetical protein
MTDSFIQVPPDSTGKKLHALQHVVGANTVQVQATHTADPNDPSRIQKVDARGQAYMRFAEGSPSLDAFGNLRVGTATALGCYDYSVDSYSDLFQDVIATGGSITWAAPETNLSVGTANGASAIRTTNRYHYYQPGVSNLIIQTLALGDMGKVNNRRRWGYFDAQNGLFWELDGTTMNVVIRNGGVDTKVAKVSWNGDVMDGTSVSAMSLDLTKANFYFVDFAWLGVGEVRFGVLGPNGERNVVHVFQNPNANIGAYMETASLPLRWENTNTGLTGGASDMRSICSAVYAQSKTDYTFWRFCDIERLTPVTVTTRTPIFSMRVAAGSRVGVYPESFNALVTGGAVMFEVLDDGVLTGATWTLTGGGVAEGDIGATSVAGGERFYSHWAAEGVAHIELGEYYETNDEGYHRLADDSASHVFTLIATKISGTTVTVAGDLNYRELR